MKTVNNYDYSPGYQSLNTYTLDVRKDWDFVIERISNPCYPEIDCCLICKTYGRLMISAETANSIERFRREYNTRAHNSSLINFMSKNSGYRPFNPYGEIPVTSKKELINKKLLLL